VVDERGVFKLIVNPMRWQVRANSYAGFVVKQYSPFEWACAGAEPGLTAGLGSG
jgi:hypothetical protein